MKEVAGAPSKASSRISAWLAAATLAVLGANGSSIAFACSCLPLDVRRELGQATLVFLGRVTALEPVAGTETPAGRTTRVRLLVVGAWKGPDEPSYTVTIGPQSTADTCVAHLDRGATYLVFTLGDHAGSCRVWKEKGPPPFTGVGSIPAMDTVIRELDRLTRRRRVSPPSGRD